MDDARHFTDYRPNCYINGVLRSANGLTNSYQMRQFLTHRATQIMDSNRATACTYNCCGPCQAPYQVGTTLPAPAGDDTALPAVSVASGRGDLACPGWNSGVTTEGDNCCATHTATADYFGPGPSVTVVRRLAVPGGGVPLQGGAHA